MNLPQGTPERAPSPPWIHLEQEISQQEPDNGPSPYTAIATAQQGSAAENELDKQPQRQIASNSLRASQSAMSTQLDVSNPGLRFEQQAPGDLQRVREAAATFLRNHRKLDSLRQSALLQRDDLNYQKEDDMYKRQYFRKSREAFVQHVSSGVYQAALSDKPARAADSGVDLSGKGLPKLRQLHEIICEDNLALQERDDSVRSALEDLSRTEFSMQSKEKRLVEAALELVHIIEDMGILGPDDVELATREPSLPSPPTEPELPDLLVDYNDKAGDVANMRDRLIEVEAQHRDEQISRNFKRDQDLPLDCSEEDFQADYQRQFSKARSDYDEAIKIEILARKACMDAGIDPDEGQSIDEEVYEPPRAAEPEYTIEPGDYPSISIYGPDPFVDEGPITPPIPNTLYAGDRFQSSTNVTALTGNINEDPFQPRRRPDLPDSEHKQTRLNQWLFDSGDASEPPVLDHPGLAPIVVSGDAPQEPESPHMGDSTRVAVPNQESADSFVGGADSAQLFPSPGSPAKEPHERGVS